MHELEAVLGVLLSQPDPSHHRILETLRQDAFADRIISDIANGPFGPRNLAQYSLEHPDIGVDATTSAGDEGK
jgi:hypothetical protein